jgi:hypothetical protein
MDTPVTDIKTIVLLLSAALGMSLVVERVLEGLNGLLNKILLTDRSPFAAKAPPIEVIQRELEGKKLKDILEQKTEELEETRVQLKTFSGQEKAALEKKAKDLEKETLFWRNKLAEQIRSQLEDKKSKLSSLKKMELKQRLEELQANGKNGEIDTSKLEFDEQFSEATVFVDPIPARDPEKTARVFWLQIIGTFAGVLICYFSKFGIFHQLLGVFSASDLRPDWILTGILIGTRSQPLHFLINFITQRKAVDLKVSTEEEVKPEEQARPEAPAVITKPEVPEIQIDIPYNGGVDRDLLEYRHKRLKNPDLIVYHHTAMHSDTTFADVVKVIKDKNWVTGYNCVILKAGSIHPFCRWDRYGSHAKGYNRRSLGIALNGNFEPDPKVPFANINGRLGIARPTDAQLLSTCKVVALWCHLYDIAVDFDSAIIPHNKISTKTCPGTNFPYDRFRKLVDSIYVQWDKSTAAKEELALYKQKQYLYV